MLSLFHNPFHTFTPMLKIQTFSWPPRDQLQLLPWIISFQRLWNGFVMKCVVIMYRAQFSYSCKMRTGCSSLQFWLTVLLLFTLTANLSTDLKLGTYYTTFPKGHFQWISVIAARSRRFDWSKPIQFLSTPSQFNITLCSERLPRA